MTPYSESVLPTDSARTLPFATEALPGRPSVLFLSWAFPPVNAPACVRTMSIAKYLARSGWKVTVLTPDPVVFRRVEDSEHVAAILEKEGIRRILTGHRLACLIPDHLKCWNAGLGWLAGGVCRTMARYFGIEGDAGWSMVVDRACATLNPSDVDVILVSGPPFGAFGAAERLSSRLGKPFVLDYRDPWTGNPHAGQQASSATVREEARMLRSCAAVTIVSPSWGEALAKRFGIESKLHIVTNGFDVDEGKDVRPYEFGHFAIVYAGSFYPPKRVISPVMAALKRLKGLEGSEDREWYFHFYGEGQEHVRDEAIRFGVMDKIVLHGRVTRAEAVSAVRGAGVTVVITSVLDENSAEDSGIIPGKVFEALGSGVPILLIAPRGSDIEKIGESAESVRLVIGTDIDGITSYFKEVMSVMAPKVKTPERYAWPNLIRRLDAVLRGVITEPRRH